jgi:hypothetical protein
VRPEERADLLASYALGTLSAPDAAAAEALARGDAEAAFELESYRDTADLIALSVPLGRADPSVRERVLREARRDQRERGRLRFRRRFSVRRYLPAAAMLAAVAAAGFWGLGMQQTISDLQQETARLTAVVESDAKRIEELQASRSDASALALTLQRELTADDVLVDAVMSDPERVATELEPTSAAHGGAGRYIWSPGANAGVLLVSNMQALPFGFEYGLWLDDATSRSTYVGSVELDVTGTGTGRLIVLDVDQLNAVRALVIPVFDGDPQADRGPVVLSATLMRETATESQ